MGKILYRNPSKSEVIGRCGGDEKTRMTTQNRQKYNAKKKQHVLVIKGMQHNVVNANIYTRNIPCVAEKRNVIPSVK